MKYLRFRRSLFQLLIVTVCLGSYSITDADDFGLIVNSPPIEMITESHLANTEFQLNIFDGGALQIRDGIRKGGGFSEVNLRGGTADVRQFGPDVVLNMSGGTLSTRRLTGRAIVSGGLVEDLVAAEGSIVRIVGGLVGDGFQAHGGSNVSLVGTDFEIDGEPIVALIPSVPTEISVRDVELTGMLADNSPFELVLVSDSFSADATLSVTLVPEPSSYTTVFIAAAFIVRLTRKSRKR